MQMFLWLLWVLGAVTAIMCAIFASTAPFNGSSKFLHWGIITFWTIGPPAWFLLEATRRIHKPGSEGELTPKEEFFFESASKFWAGFLALLTAIYASRNFSL